MGRWLAAAAQAARAVRGLWPDHNPLRRGLDRAEAAIVAILAVVFLAGAPLVAAAAWHAAYRAAVHTAHARQSWHRAPAVLLASAPSSWGSKYGTSVPARWAAPDGTRHTGTVPVPWGVKAGSTVMVWVDASGRAASLPLRPPGAEVQAALAAVAALAAAGLLVVCAGLLGHGVLGRRRMAAWDSDWQVTEPRWTRRR